MCACVRVRVCVRESVSLGFLFDMIRKMCNMFYVIFSLLLFSYININLNQIDFKQIKGDQINSQLSNFTLTADSCTKTANCFFVKL